MNKPLVSVDWLPQNLQADDLVILDTSIKNVTQADSKLAKTQIPGARFFDIKNVFSDLENPFPNAVPSEEKFTKEAQVLGINQNSKIVVYDDKGIYSSARVWYLFKAFGHENVAVLDGGLPEWLRANYRIEDKKVYPTKKGNFVGKYNPKYFKFFNDIQKSIKNSNELILDARITDRFYGLVDEPRKGLRSGHIPNSKNLPYTDLLQENKLKTENEIISIFNTFDCKDKSLIFSCGSGISACVLALGADKIGFKDISVYDGSWTEYGTLTN